MLSTRPTRSLAWTLVAAFAACIASISAADFSLPGINYNIRLGPDWAVQCKDPDTIASDMKIIASISKAVRLFSLVDCNQAELVVPAAIQANLTVSLGLWVSNDSTVFANEIAKLETLLESHLNWFTGGHIADIHVGSEAIYRKDVTVAENIQMLTDTRELVSKYDVSGVPLTIAEIGDTYINNPELVQAVDVVQANGFPFWERIEVSQAPVFFSTRIKPLLDLAGSYNKRVEIGETGWASGGSNPNASEASAVNAARYFRNFVALASEKTWKFYYFEAFDAQWKAEVSAAAQDTVEAHFGLCYANGTLKSEFAEVIDGYNSSASSTSSSGNSNGNSNSNSNSTSGSSTSVSSVTESAAYLPSNSTTNSTTNSTMSSPINSGSTTTTGSPTSSSSTPTAGSGAATTTTSTSGASGTLTSTPLTTSDTRRMCHSSK